MTRASLCFAVLVAACGSRGTLPAPPHADGGLAEAPTDGSVATGTRDSSVAADTSVADASADLTTAPVEPSDGGWNTYAKAMDERFDQWSSRAAECFAASRERLILDREPLDADPGLAVELGEIVVDEAAVRACLRALGSATCDDLVSAAGPVEGWRGTLEPCSRMILKRGPVVGRCHHDEACPSLQCGDRDQSCGNVGACQPAPAPAGPGESCKTRPCTSDAFCDGNADDLCRPLGKQGADCRQDEQCAFGFYCARSSKLATSGVCRPAKRGAPCAGTWECPRLLACVGAAAGTSGTCQPGKPVGAPCVPQGEGIARDFSDCGYKLKCVDIAGVGGRCRAGSAIGEACYNSNECIAGYCDRATNDPSGTCRVRQSGGACRTYDACAPPAYCMDYSQYMSGTCQTPPKRPQLGEACMASQLDRGACGLLAYCRANVRPDDPGTTAPGRCERFKKAGEPCAEGWDRCEPLARCANGTCTRC